MTRITNLVETSTYNNNDVLIVSDGQLTKKITVENFKTSILQLATKTSAGTIKVGSGLEITDAGVLSVRNYSGYSLPYASASTLGGIKVGNGLAIDVSGTLSTTYTLPFATVNNLGGVKIGSGLNIANDGTLSVDSTQRDQFAQGIQIGSNQELKLFVSTGLSRVRSETIGTMELSVLDTETATGFSSVKLLSALDSAAIGGSNSTVIPGTADEDVSLGIVSRPWKDVHAETHYGDFVGNLTGNVSGNVTGNLLSESASVAYNKTTNTFVGNFTGNVTGNADTATKLFSQRLINNVFFDGTSDITVYDNTKLNLTGGTLTGQLLLNADPTAPTEATTKNYVDTRVNTRLSKAGGTLTGFLTLNDPPQNVLHAATKGYVDGNIITRLPYTGGVLTGFITLHNDPVQPMHPTTKAYVDTKVYNDITANNVTLTSYIDTQDAKKLNLTGGSLTGYLGLHANPTQPEHAARKAYVDSNVNTKVSKTGDTLSGYLVLHDDPTMTTHATTKRYVDNAVSNLNTSLRLYVDANDDTKLNLTGGVLTGALTLDSDPTSNMHPATKQYVDNIDSTLQTLISDSVSPKLNKSGGTMTGILTLSSNPTNNLHAATKQYVDTSVSTLNTTLQSYVDSQTSTKLNISGGTLTGRITLSAEPTSAMHAANKGYVDAKLDDQTVKAWIRFSGASGAIYGSKNITGIVKNGTGQFTIYITPGIVTSEWFGMAGIASDHDHIVSLNSASIGGATTSTSISVRLHDTGGSNNTADSTADVSVIIVG